MIRGMCLPAGIWANPCIGAGGGPAKILGLKNVNTTTNSHKNQTFLLFTWSKEKNTESEKDLKILNNW